MKISEHHYKYHITGTLMMRKYIRRMEERANLDEGETYTLTLKNLAQTLDVDIQMKQTEAGVRFLLLKKSTYDRKVVYRLVSDELGLLNEQ